MRKALVKIQFSDVEGDGVKWIEALEPKTYGTKRWGQVPVTETKLNNFVKNFNEGVRTGDIAIDYDHRTDVNKGSKAAGWLKGARITDGGKLEVGVELTPTAKKEIADSEWKYFSVEWEDNYEDTTTGTKASDVIIGGALTNRPIAKGMKPINFSELERDDEFIEAVYAGPSEEIMEPGTNNPNLTDTDLDDTAGGSRINTPFPGYDGSIVDVPSTVTNSNGNSEPGGDPQLDLLQELRKLYGLGEDVDDAAVIKHVSDEHIKFSDLQDTSKKLSEAMTFNEQYPEQARLMAELQDRAREAEAKQFSESLVTRRITRSEGEGENAKDTVTNLGLSGLAIETARETHKKFSEGVATVEDLTKLVDSIFKDGVVEYGERGSTQFSESGGNGGAAGGDDVLPTNVTDIRTKMLEKTKAVMDKKKDDGSTISFSEAVAVVASENPALYEAYRTVNPAG